MNIQVRLVLKELHAVVDTESCFDNLSNIYLLS